MDYIKGINLAKTLLKFDKHYFFRVLNLFIVEYMKTVYVYFDPPGIK